MAYTKDDELGISLPKVASRKRTMRPDYNWPERNRPIFMATRTGAMMMPKPAPGLFATTAAAMWQPAAVNATMLPGFYRNARMGSVPQSPIVKTISSVPETYSKGLGDYEMTGSYYDLGATGCGVVPTGAGSRNADGTPSAATLAFRDCTLASVAGGPSSFQYRQYVSD